MGLLPTSSLPFRVGKEMVSEWVLIGFIISFVISNPFLKMFMLWLLIRCITNYNQWAYIEFNTIFFYTLCFQIIVNKFNKQHLILFYNAVCVMALLQVLVMVLQYIGVWWVVVPMNYKELEWTIFFKDSFAPLYVSSCFPFMPFKSCMFVGFMSHMNEAGALIALCFPFFMRKKWVYCIPVMIIGLLLGRSMGGIAPVFIVSLIWLIYKYGKKAFFVLIFLFVAFCSYIIIFENIHDLITGTQRFEVWKIIMKDIIPVKMFAGWGVGQFKILFPAIHKTIANPLHAFEQAHNEYLQAIVEYGLIGITFILGYVVLLFIKIWNHKTSLLMPLILSMVVIFINSGVHFLLHTTTALLAITIVAVFENYVKKES